MKLNIIAATVTLALLSACGGSSDTVTGTVDGPAEETTVIPVVAPVDPTPTESDRDNTPTEGVDTEDRTRPGAGLIVSDGSTYKSNGADLYSDTGPQVVSSERVISWPGLRYGNFLVSNNPWNASSASYPDWYQDISLYETDAGYGVHIDWDWGSKSDTNGSIFDTKSYPEVIYGTKSPGERSGTFAETGLPVEIYDAPIFTLDYAFSYTTRDSDSTTTGGDESEFNVAIESFYHESCDVQRTGSEATSNTVFETMVWLKTGVNKPSGQAPVSVFATSDGRAFDVYTKTSNFHYIAFVAQEEQLSGTVLYSELLNHAQDFATEYNIYPLKDTDCLANILMGTEIWYGAGSFSLDSFQVNRLY